MALLQEKDSHPRSEKCTHLSEGDDIADLAHRHGHEDEKVSYVLKDGDEKDFLLLGFDKADEVDGFEKAGEDYDPPQSGWSLNDESRKKTQGKEEGQIEEDPKEENPEEKSNRPVSPLHSEIPCRMEKGRNDDEEDAERRQRVTRFARLERK